MQDFWRVPFTIMMIILLAFLVLVGLCHSITLGVIFGVFGWLIQGLCIWMATECQFPRVIVANLLVFWCDRILRWACYDNQN